MPPRIFRSIGKNEHASAYHGTVEDAIVLARQTLLRRSEDTRTLDAVLSNLEHIDIPHPVRIGGRALRRRHAYHARIGLADAAEIADRGIPVVGLLDGSKGTRSVFAIFDDSGNPVYARVFSHEEMDEMDAAILGASVVSMRAYRVPIPERVNYILQLIR